MKVFISGRLDDAQQIRRYMDMFEKVGHEITHDWTSSDVFLGSREAKLAYTDESARRAAADIDGVLASDVYIYYSNNATLGKGMYVELGASLAKSSFDKHHKTFVVGAMNHMTVFFLHPSVIRCDSVEEVLTRIS